MQEAKGKIHGILYSAVKKVWLTALEADHHVILENRYLTWTLPLCVTCMRPQQH